MSSLRRVSTLIEAMESDASPPTAVLFTDLADIRWLTGFTGSNAWLLVRSDEQFLFTDGRYVAQAGDEIASVGGIASVVPCTSGATMSQSVQASLRRDDRVWFQSSSLTVATYRALTAASSLSDVFVPAPSTLSRIRRIKDPEEVVLIEKACRIADQALADALHTTEALDGGRCTERDLRDELDHRMRRLGADGPSYDTIVATGPRNSALPHHRPDDTLIENGHSLVIDVGALVSGYHSDMTRSYIVGEGSPEQFEWYGLVLESHCAGVAAIEAGVPASEIHATCASVFDRDGLAQFYVHGTGHGVGLVIHEEPFLNSTSNAVLLAGEVVTVEPGLYRGGFGGFRVEDLVLVTETGCRPLNTSAKEPTCPPSPPTT